MPLLMTKIHVLNKILKKERKSKDGGKSESTVPPPKYVIDQTNELCENEEEYNRKTMLYKEKVWTCRCTGRSNLSYKEAMKSEQSSLKILKKSFPKCFEKPVLELVHHTVDSLDNIVHKAYILIHQEFCINEPVSLKVNQSGKASIEGLIVKVDKSSNETKCPETTNGTTSSPSDSSDKENSVRKSPTGPPSKKEYFYSIKLLDQDKIVSRVPASAINRDVKPPAKDHIRLFIRAHSMRYGHNVTGPWIVDEDYVKKCKLQSKNKDFEIDKDRLKAYSVQQEIEQMNRIKSKAAGGSGSVSKKPRILYLKGEILKAKTNQQSSDDEDEDVPLMQIKKKQEMFATPLTNKKKMKQATLFDLTCKSGKSGNSSFKPNFTPSRSIPPIATRLIKLIRENKPESVISQITTRCAQFLNDSQISVLPLEIRDRVKERKIKLDEKKMLEAMTPEQREEFLKKKRQETIEKQREKKRLQNRRFEDTELENQTLPLTKPLNLEYSEGLSSEQLAQVISLAEMLRCFKGLLIPVEAEKSWREWDGTLDHYRSVYGQIIVRAERLCWALTSGKEGSIYLGHLLTVMLQTLLQDDSMSRRRELNSKLSEIPVTPYTVSEMLRLVLKPPDKKSSDKKMKKSKSKYDDSSSVKKENADDDSEGEESRRNGDAGSSDHESESEDELDPYAMEDSAEMRHLCDRLSQVEFHDLTLNEKLSLLRGMQQRILDLEMLDEHIDECQRKLTEAYKKKISELKKRNDKIREEKAKKKENSQLNDKDKTEKSKSSKKSKKAVPKSDTKNNVNISELASDDLASIVKRRRVLAAQAHREKELKEEAERKRRQIEAQELAEERLLQAVNKELEESLAEVKNVFRMTPLGTDRYHNRYWLFPTAPPGLYVEKNWAADYCSYSVDCKKIKNYSPSKYSMEITTDGNERIETTLPTSGKPLLWEMYNTVEELDDLMKKLNPLGVRESKLKQELKNVVEEIKTNIKAQQNLKLKENSCEMNCSESHDSANEDPLITGFKTELNDSYTRLINGGLSITESNLPWLDRIQAAKSRDELARCLIEVQESVYERFFCGPFAPRKDSSAGPDSTEIIESPWIAEWRAAVLSAPTQSRLNMLQGYLDACIRWEKSIADAKCRICRRKNDDILILCDSCNQAFHMYCLRPPVVEPPSGDWFCPGCKPLDKRRAKQGSDGNRKLYKEESDSNDSEAENDPECLVCDTGEEQELVHCTGCPNTFHFQCHEPALRHKPRGDWYCSDCRLGTNLRKRLKGSKRKPAARKHSSRSSGLRGKKYEEPASDEEKKSSNRKVSAKRSSKATSKPTKIESNDASSNEDSDTDEDSDSNRKSTTRSQPARTSKKRKVESEEDDEDDIQPRRRSQRQTAAVSFRSIEESSDEEGEPRKSKYSRSSRGSATSGKSRKAKRSASSDEEGKPEAISRPPSKRQRINKSTERSLNEQLNIANTLLDSMWKHRAAWPFTEPVNVDEVPDYLDFVSHPIDLSTMKEKLRQKMYTSLADVIKDIHQMFINVELYNEPQTDVFQTSRKLEHFFHSQMEKLAPDTDYKRSSS